MKDTLYELETSLLKADTRQSKEKLDQLIADDFYEITSSGKIFDKKHMLEDLPAMAVPEFTIFSFEIKELSQDVFQTRFEIERTLNGEATPSLRTSIWRRTSTGWKMFFHQGTIIKK